MRSSQPLRTLQSRHASRAAARSPWVHFLHGHNGPIMNFWQKTSFSQNRQVRYHFLSILFQIFNCFSSFFVNSFSKNLFSQKRQHPLKARKSSMRGIAYCHRSWRNLKNNRSKLISCLKYFPNRQFLLGMIFLWTTRASGPLCFGNRKRSILKTLRQKPTEKPSSYWTKNGVLTAPVWKSFIGPESCASRGSATNHCLALCLTKCGGTPTMGCAGILPVVGEILKRLENYWNVEHFWAVQALKASNIDAGTL